MTITDPTPLLDFDMDRMHDLLGTNFAVRAHLKYVEPGAQEARSRPVIGPVENESPMVTKGVSDAGRVVIGRVQTLGDFIDTDALAPAEALVDNPSIENMGKYCLYHTHPEFRNRVKEDGLNIVVAGKAFGVGSSRENAVTALIGAGVQCVIARSFAFIYGRNQPNLGLLGFVMNDEEFYRLATDGAEIKIDVHRRILQVSGVEFGFTLSDLEAQLWQQGGMSTAFARWGKGLLEQMTSGRKAHSGTATMERSAPGDELRW
jgi:3-isopropylmalate dehydratase small subunit